MNVLDTTIVVGIVARIIGNFTSDRIVPHPKSGEVGIFFVENESEMSEKNGYKKTKYKKG